MHVFAGNQRLASVFGDGTGKIQFYHGNHLGSASVITDQYGGRKEQIEYFPYGTYRAAGSPQGTYDFDPAFPDVLYTFTGQEDDDDLGLYNFKARLYDPLLGKFISPDSLVPDPDNPQAFNRYSYCQNNPLKYIDPNGKASQWHHYNITYNAAIAFGLSHWQAKQWAEAFMNVDFAPNALSKSADIANIHGMGGRLPDATWQTTEEAIIGTWNVIGTATNFGIYTDVVNAMHAGQDLCNHKGESMENWIFNIDTAKHIKGDIVLNDTEKSCMYNFTLSIFEAEFNPPATYDIQGTSSSPGISYDPGTSYAAWISDSWISYNSWTYDPGSNDPGTFDPGYW